MQVVAPTLDDSHVTAWRDWRHGQARRFLQRLDPEAEAFTFQTFDDTPETRGELARIMHGEFDHVADTLEGLQQQRAGVFVTVAVTDGGGRQAHNVERVRAVFVDLDGAPLEPVLKAGLEPHIVCESSPGRWHCYWLTDDCPREQFERVQRALARRFGGDPKVHDLPRVMRLPGFRNFKREACTTPHLLEEIGSNGPPYALAEIVAALRLDLNAEEEKSQARPNGEGKILQGGRDNFLTSIAGTMRRRGMSQEAILAGLCAENAARCDPPLPDRDVQRIVASVGRYAAAERAEAGENNPQPLPGYTVASIWQDYTPPRYLVKRLLGAGELTVLFGQSGHFKSVAAIDIALCVGSGTEFHGLKVRKAGVLYVAGEGHGGIRKRIRAWCMKRGLDSSAEQPAVYVTSQGANLLRNPEQLSATVEHAAAVLGVPIELVVFDTLAANFGPGDENLTADMTLALDGARIACGNAARLIVHHTGHGQVERERGSYALIAAADYRVQAVYDDVSKLLELKWLKCKDDERPEPFTFEWHKVPVEWVDEDGEELTSVVIERLEGVNIPQGPRSTGLGKNQETALRALRTLYAKRRKNVVADGRDPSEARVLLDGWRGECDKRGLNRQRWNEVLKDLQDRQLIALDGPHVRLAEAFA